jgi:hypothetical protein
MKWKIIIQKGKEVKEGIITVTSAIQKVSKIIESHGWNVTYLVPIEPINEDKNTQIINLGNQ